jgi:hypothetical protein
MVAVAQRSAARCAEEANGMVERVMIEAADARSAR